MARGWRGAKSFRTFNACEGIRRGDKYSDSAPMVQAASGSELVAKRFPRTGAGLVNLRHFDQPDDGPGKSLYLA